MCGIVGFINNDMTTKYAETVRTVFHQLLWHDTQRGPDGTGVLVVNGGKDNMQSTMYKSALWAPEFLGGNSYNRIIGRRLDWARLAIGHNRATTRGRVSNDNAHPFEHKHITLVHNGFIPNPDNYVPKEYRHEVDSFAACYNIAERGEIEGLQYIPFQGVLVWWNEKDKTLNMARNEHRTLYCVGVDGHDTLFYASEWRMLDWILDRNGLKPETKYKLLTPWNHFKFDPMKPKEWVRSSFQKPLSLSIRSTHGSGATTATGFSSTTNGQATGQSQTASTSGSKEDDDLARSFPKRPDQVTDAEIRRIETQFRNLTPKQRNKYGIPNGANKIRKVCAKIANSGLDSYLGQRFIVYPDGYAPYKNQRKNGVIFGTKRDSDIRVEIPNSSPEDFDRLRDDKYLFGTVVNVKKQKTGWVLVAALIPLDAYKEELQDEPEEKQEQMLPGPTGQQIPLSKFMALCQTGCGNCSGFINPNYANDMLWFAGEPICHICASDEDIRSHLGFEPKQKAVVHH